MSLLKLLSRRWWYVTLLVIAASGVMIRLGIWQLSRLAERRAFNAQVNSARAQPPFNLNQMQPQNLTQMEWRQVEFTGKYDFANQVAIRNQYFNGQYGYHLMTPLIADSASASASTPVAVVVDRGWIPADGNAKPEDWRKYDQAGEVKVAGQLRLGQPKPAFGGVADALPADGSKLEIWSNADLAQIAKQIPYPILPVYIQPNPDPNDAEPPIPVQPELDLTEGPHMGYALQWFSFAGILFFGYPFYVRKQEAKGV